MLYHKTKLGVLFHADCFEALKILPANSINCVLSDFPYNVIASDWDKEKIDLGGIWTQYKRILKPDSVSVLTACQPFTTDLINSNRDSYKYSWIWVKPQGVDPFMSKIRPLNNYEEILVFADGKVKYNPQFNNGKPYKVTRDKKDRNFETTGTTLKETTTENDGFRYPVRTLYFKQERGYHPTQKPVELFLYLLETYTNKGDVVLDTFSGSGTTALACEQLGRRWVAIEREEKYCQITKKRLIELEGINDR